MSNPNISTGPTNEAKQIFTGMRAVLVGASAELAYAFVTQRMANDPPIRIEVQTNLDSIHLPSLLAGSQIAILAYGSLTYDIARQCTDLRHVIFLTDEAHRGAETKMVERLGIIPHTIGEPAPSTAKAIADAAIEQCRRIVSPTGG